MAKSAAVMLGALTAAVLSTHSAFAQSILERQEAMFRRNVGSPEEQRAQFPPHRIAGNLYYVGSQSLASFLVATPNGHILINTNWEDGVPNLRKSIEDLGFRFEDVEIVLGSHAHADHMQGDALVKALTGATVMAMAEDVPLLERMQPGGRTHPIDRVLHDGDEVTLGGSTLVARRTPGHTPGCTTWTMTVEEQGERYDVVIIGSMGSNPGFRFVNNPTNPTIADHYRQGFAVLRSLSPDIPLASHPAMYDMVEKHARIGGTPNPFVDPAGYVAEIDAVEQLFLEVLAEQEREAAGSNTPAAVGAGAQSWTARTPDGQPDLQGTWVNFDSTPFEAPQTPTGPPAPGGGAGVNPAAEFAVHDSPMPEARRSMVVDPPDGRVPVMPWAEQQRDHDLEHVPDAPEHETPWVRCITRGFPAGMFQAGYNNAHRIIQIPGHVVIASEMIHETRIIPVDGRSRLGEGIRHWNGDSRGRWEGDTLIVETTNFNDKGDIATSGSQGRIRGIPQTSAMRVVERFRRVDADTIEYEVTIVDPTTYTAPWTVAMPFTRDDEYRFLPYECHEGNMSLPNALSFGRVRDAEATRRE